MIQKLKLIGNLPNNYQAHTPYLYVYIHTVHICINTLIYTYMTKENSQMQLSLQQNFLFVLRTCNSAFLKCNPLTRSLKKFEPHINFS